jgi:hypothetical protein
MRWVRKETIIEIQSEVVAIKGYLQFEHVKNCKKHIFVSLLQEKLKGDILIPG